MFIEQRSKEYAERELQRCHTGFSIYYVHPRAQWIFRLFTTFVPIIWLTLNVFTIIVIIRVLLHFNIDIEQICKDSYLATSITFFLTFIGYFFTLIVANWIFCPVYFLGHYFGCITFDEALALTKNPWVVKSLFWETVA